MGWSCHWFLVRDGEPAAVAQRLGGRLGTRILTEEDATTRAAPGPAVGPAVNGWRIITDPHWQLIDDAVVVALSAGGHVLEFVIEEHVSYTAASSWRDGVEEWSLTFDPNAGGIKAQGDPPQAGGGDEDPFEAPASLIESLTGWVYHDADPGVESEPFVAVVGIPPPARAKRRLHLW